MLKCQRWRLKEGQGKEKGPATGTSNGMGQNNQKHLRTAAAVGSRLQAAKAAEPFQSRGKAGGVKQEGHRYSKPSGFFKSQNLH